MKSNIIYTLFLMCAFGLISCSHKIEQKEAPMSFDQMDISTMATIEDFDFSQLKDNNRNHLRIYISDFNTLELSDISLKDNKHLKGVFIKDSSTKKPFGISEINRLGLNNNIESLSIYGSNIIKLRDIGCIEKLTGLRELSFSYNGSLKFLEKLKKLKYFYLKTNNEQSEVIKYVKKLKNLRYFKLNDSVIKL